MIRAFKNEVELPLEWRIQRYDVIDNKGKFVAPVQDLLWDPEAREVRYVMLEIGGVMRIAGKRLLVPPALFIRAGSGQVQALVAQEDIMDAPAPEDHEHPKRGEEEAIFDYFKTAPYWEQAGLYKKETTAAEDEKEAATRKITLDKMDIGDLHMENNDKGNG